MAKGTMTFNLPEEQGEYEIALRAGRAACAASEFRGRLQAWNKWGIEAKTPEEAVEQIYQAFCESFDEEGLARPEEPKKEWGPVVTILFYGFCVLWGIIVACSAILGVAVLGYWMNKWF